MHNFSKSSKASTKSVIFDLDGTLIDSQKSILEAIAATLSELGLEAKIPLTQDLIGPPLIVTISKIIGINDRLIIDEVVTKFKLYYDTKNCSYAVVYPGIQKLLYDLYQEGYGLYIATNKRLIPTIKIVDHLAWRALFIDIYCIDLNLTKPFKNKSEMISVLLKNESVNHKSAIYIGDRLEDFEAAKDNNLPCILVNWGYESKGLKLKDSINRVNNSIELLNTIQKML